MTENEQAPQPSTEQSDTPSLLPVTRDAGFVRIAADDVIVVHRKGDVQISLIVEGPEPIKQAMPGRRKNGFQVQEVQLAHSFTEIARVGLPSGKAFSMAMNIVEAAVEAGKVPVGVFRDRFLAMLEEHEKTGVQTTKPPAPRRKR
jgi:hypothetical protein